MFSQRCEIHFRDQNQRISELLSGNDGRALTINGVKKRLMKNEKVLKTGEIEKSFSAENVDDQSADLRVLRAKIEIPRALFACQYPVEIRQKIRHETECVSIKLNYQVVGIACTQLQGISAFVVCEIASSSV